MLAWQQQLYDQAVADLFGFYAVQICTPGLDCLRANRMPNRIGAWLAGEFEPPACAGREDAAPHLQRVVFDEFEELPFATQSIDLVALPQVLEFSRDPHRVLREVDRVLRPEGRLLVSGFNPVSLWGARQILMRPFDRPFLPREGQFIGVPRLRDWFKLLSFEAERGRFGCYAPPCRTERWLQRMSFMEKAGDRWWPICGAIYFVAAVKRVTGMRLVGPVWKTARARRLPIAVASPPRVPLHRQAPGRRPASHGTEPLWSAGAARRRRTAQDERGEYM
ncbi:MAG: class I SAM-dependent methyltransferase [Burkholderiales bacterium]|nr:MAG: class I SAM-dependent methyltransferase [Burkholderiales bacterium]